MRFRPCIDLHQGKVKQIVGSTMQDDAPDAVTTNFVAAQPSSHYARMYRDDGLQGGHVIMLGPGNEREACNALAEYPGGLQIGGGIRPENAPAWLQRGASKVIVTSYLFAAGTLCRDRLHNLTDTVGRENLVLDLSCRRVGDNYVVVADRWQTVTDVNVLEPDLARLAGFCSEFLVHGVDVEGKQSGLEQPLVELLADISPLPVTYAGGVRTMQDVQLVETLGHGRIDVTVGSALDIFGGQGVRYRDLVEFDRDRR